MKINALLFLVLVSLLTFTYFFQEKKIWTKYAEENEVGKLVDFPIQKISLPNIKAEKKAAKWFNGEQLLSHQLFEKLEERLLQIKLIKILDQIDQKVLDGSLSFKINDHLFKLGEISIDKESFYVYRDGKIFLGKIDGASAGVSLSEADIEEDKLEELKSLMSMPSESYAENHLIRYYENFFPEKVLLHRDGAEAYELNFANNSTSPLPLKGIEVHKDIKSKFMSHLNQIQIKKEFTLNELKKFKRLAVINFRQKNSKLTLWEIWQKNRESADAILIDPDKKKAFMINGQSLKLFFLNVQDYWDKKIIPSDKFKNFENLKFELSQNEKNEKLEVFNREPLVFKASTSKMNQEHLGELLHLLFNLGPFDQADRISQLTSSERGQFLDRIFLKIKIMGQNLICFLKNGELIAVNLDLGIKFHFYRNPQNIKCDLKDMVE